MAISARVCVKQLDVGRITAQRLRAAFHIFGQAYTFRHRAFVQKALPKSPLSVLEPFFRDSLDTSVVQTKALLHRLFDCKLPTKVGDQHYPAAALYCLHTARTFIQPHAHLSFVIPVLLLNMVTISRRRFPLLLFELKKEKRGI